MYSFYITFWHIVCIQITIELYISFAGSCKHSIVPRTGLTPKFRYTSGKPRRIVEKYCGVTPCFSSFSHISSCTLVHISFFNCKLKELLKGLLAIIMVKFLIFYALIEDLTRCSRLVSGTLRHFLPFFEQERAKLVKNQILNKKFPSFLHIANRVLTCITF